MILDPFAIQKALLSLSLITLAISLFSSSYTTISSVEKRIRERISIQHGVPLKQSKEYCYLTKTDLMKVVKKCKCYSTITAIALVACLVSIFCKPNNIENYKIMICNHGRQIGIVDEKTQDGKDLLLQASPSVNSTNNIVPKKQIATEVKCYLGIVCLISGNLSLSPLFLDLKILY